MKGGNKLSTINDRFKEIRNYYGLSQEEFGGKLGLSKSGISNIESGTRNVTNKHIKLLCSTFPISEKWLRDGTEPKTIKTSASVMEQLKKEFNLDEFSYNLVYEYLKLEPDQRDVVRNFFYSVVKEDETAVTSDSISSNACTVAEAEEAYIKSRSRTAKKTGQYVLNTTANGASAESISEKAANQ